MPIDRAVPAMIFSASSRSLALRSCILVCAISRTWSRVTVATLVLCGSPEPFYLAEGFVPTGEVDDGEVVARRPLP